MTGRTHDLSAFTLLNVVFVMTPTPQMSVATAVVAFMATFIGGLLPDVDQPTADLYRRIPAGNVFGRMVAPILGSHRMISHSFLGIVLSGFLLDKLLIKLSTIVLIDMRIVWWATMIGFVSHIIVDFITREGCPLLFPFPWKFGFPPISRMRLKTGGFMEKTIIYPGLLLLNGYLVYEYREIYLAFFKQYIH